MKRLNLIVSGLIISVFAIAQDGHTVGEVPSDEGLFPFVISYDLARGATDCSALLDAPAGKHGFTRIEDRHFVNDAGRIRFNGVNIVGGANFPSHRQAKRMARRIAHLGFNIVRLHYFDLSEYTFRDIKQKGILVDDGTYVTFDPEQLDLFDYMFFQFKKNGIYSDINLLVGRRFKRRNGFDKDLQQKELEYARALLTHVNPYTGLAYVDDPAVAVIELNNENAVVTDILRWKHDLGSGEGAPDWPNYARLSESADEYRLEMLEVFETADMEHWNRQRDFLINELGVKVPITGSQVNYSTPWASQQMDFFDMHAYWCHPEQSADIDKWTIENLPMVNETDGAKLTELATYRPVDRPFTVSEYNHPFPNLYGAEGQPMLHAYGAFQDWDGLIGHSYHNLSDVEPDCLAYNFTYAARTDAIAHFPACALMFLRGDVQASSEEYVQNLTREVYERDWAENLRFWISEKLEMASGNTFLRPQRLIHRVATDFFADEGKVFQKEELGQTVFSDGGEIEWNHDIPDRGMFIVRTGNSKVFSGFPAGRSIDWGDGVSFELGPTKLGWTTMSLVSMKGNGFKKHSRCLLVATGYTKHTGQKFTVEPDESDPAKPSAVIHSRHEDWGTGPMLTEGIPATLRLPSKAGRTRCWALNERGKRSKRLPVTKDAEGNAIIEIGPQYRTVWYEIRVR